MRNGALWVVLTGAVLAAGAVRGEGVSAFPRVTPRHYNAAAGVGVGVEGPHPDRVSLGHVLQSGTLLSCRVVWNWGHETREAWFHQGVFGATYSPALRGIVVLTPTEVWVVDVDGAACRRVFAAEGLAINRGMVANPEGTRVVLPVLFVETEEVALVACDLITGECREERMDVGLRAWMSDGERIALRGVDCVWVTTWRAGAGGLRRAELPPTDAWLVRDWNHRLAHGVYVHEDRHRVRWAGREIRLERAVEHVKVVGDEVWTLTGDMRVAERFEWATGELLGMHAVLFKDQVERSRWPVESDETARWIVGDFEGSFWAIDGEGNVEELPGLDLRD